jgi:Putative auto-transporter adhesin, head GIN domain
MVSKPHLRFAIALLAACAACSAAAAQRREARNASDFTAITLSAPLKLELVQGDRDSLELEGDERALAEIEAVVEDRTLKLRLRNRLFLNWNYKVRAIVTARRIAALTIDGSGDIVAGKLHAEALKIAIVGSGDARIGELAAASLEIAIKGSGDVIVSGRADAVTASIVGSGSIKRLGPAAP